MFIPPVEDYFKRVKIMHPPAPLGKDSTELFLVLSEHWKYLIVLEGDLCSVLCSKFIDLAEIMSRLKFGER